MTILKNQHGLEWESSICSDLQSCPLLCASRLLHALNWSAEVLPTQGLMRHHEACAYNCSNRRWYLRGSFMDHSDFRELLFPCDLSAREAALRRTRLRVFAFLARVWKCSRWCTCACVSNRAGVQGWVRNGQTTSFCNLTTLSPAASQALVAWASKGEMENTLVFCKCRIDNYSCNQIIIYRVIGFLY